MSNKNIFVFALCGVDKWLNQLNISLINLKNFSKNKIIVVTDLSRNRIEIDNEHIINMSTPSVLNDVEASLFLKTSLHKILDMSDNYCYLDSGVIALKNGVDRIFNHNYGIVTFSNDFCRINEVSPYLVNCSCIIENHAKKDNLNQIFKQFSDYKDEGKKLKDVLKHEKKIFKKLWIFLTSHFQIRIKRLYYKYLDESKQYLSGQIKFNFYKVFKIKLFLTFKFDEDQVCERFNEAWLDTDNDIIYCEHMKLSDYIATITGFKYNKAINEWTDKDNLNIFAEPVCDHLTGLIKRTYNVRISKGNWQHWNSSVFLFNSFSGDFMDLWHKNTLLLFQNKELKINDIPSLAATVWKLKLQNCRTLPTEFQLIANFRAQNVRPLDDGKYSTDEGGTILSPYFINIASGFGDNNREVWKSVEKLINGLKSQ